MSKNKKPKIDLLLDGLDQILNVKTVVQINTSKKFIYIEEIKEGSNEYRLSYTSNLIKDDEIKKLKSIQIMREKDV